MSSVRSRSSADSADVDPVRLRRKHLMDPRRIRVRQRAGRSESGGLPRHGRGAQDGPRTTRIVDVVRLHEERTALPEGFPEMVPPGEDARDAAVHLVREHERRGMVFHDLLSGEADGIRHAAELLVRLRRRVFRVEDHRAADVLREGHPVLEDFVRRRPEVRGDAEVGPPDLAEGDGLPIADEFGGEVHAPLHCTDRRRQSERLVQSEQVHRVRANRHEYGHLRLPSDEVGRFQRPGVRGTVVLAGGQQEIVVWEMREHEVGPARLLEHPCGFHVEPARVQMEVVVEDRHRQRMATPRKGFPGGWRYNAVRRLIFGADFRYATFKCVATRCASMTPPRKVLSLAVLAVVSFALLAAVPALPVERAGTDGSHTADIVYRSTTGSNSTSAPNYRAEASSWT